MRTCHSGVSMVVSMRLIGCQVQVPRSSWPPLTGTVACAPAGNI
ncbi:hypothetical protein ACFVWZ_22955 [Streptomyces sp. NPDC058200]